jgi:hypothetical protein
VDEDGKEIVIMTNTTVRGTRGIEDTLSYLDSIGVDREYTNPGTIRVEDMVEYLEMIGLEDSFSNPGTVRVEDIEYLTRLW